MPAPFVNDLDFTLHVGDSLDVLSQLPAESVHCCVTSPPYWGLRDYGTGTWDGGDSDCDHQGSAQPQAKDTLPPSLADGPKPGMHGDLFTKSRANPSRECLKCGATRVDQQLGLEPTPDEYVANMVAVFREVRRVLRADGTLWLNIGDSYAGSWGAQSRGENSALADRSVSAQQIIAAPKRVNTGSWVKDDPMIKPKDLVGIPWRLAFALQADGWCLRSDIVWSKPNPMPESVTDRPTKAHEYLFLLTPCTWSGGIEPWPMIREDAIWLAALVDGEGTICFQEHARKEWAATISCRLSIVNTNRALLDRVAAITQLEDSGTPSPRRRNDGAPGRPIFTWQVTNEKAARIVAAIRPHLIAKQTQAELALYVHTLNQKHKGRGGHRTTDSDLALKRKASAACSALNHGEDVDLAWFKPVKPGRWVTPKNTFYDADAIREAHVGPLHAPGNKPAFGTVQRNDFGTDRMEATWDNEAGRNKRSVWEIATAPYPDAHFATFPPALVEPCVKAGCPEDGVVLDPFMGSGTTALVARRLGRRSIGIELNPEYAELCARRLQQQSLFA